MHRYRNTIFITVEVVTGNRNTIERLPGESDTASGMTWKTVLPLPQTLTCFLGLSPAVDPVKVLRCS